MNQIECGYLEKIRALLKQETSFAISGITNCSKLILLSQIKNIQKKDIIFITETEQTALKFQNDLKILFNIESVIFPYQDGSIYDSNSKNLYKYAKQIDIIENYTSSCTSDNKSSIIIIPQKALIEKFPDISYFKENKITINVNDDINVEELAKKLINYGYKRKTLVADIGEFSIRGDIIDIYPLTEQPYRIELWGDSVTDIRIFDNKTQKSIEKTKKAEILPIYKFILNDDSYKRIKPPENGVNEKSEIYKEIIV